MVGKQLGFSDYELTTAKKQTKREKFLSEMEVVVPWPMPCSISAGQPTSLPGWQSRTAEAQALAGLQFVRDLMAPKADDNTDQTPTTKGLTHPPGQRWGSKPDKSPELRMFLRIKGDLCMLLSRQEGFCA